MKNILTSLLFITSISIFAQTGIGTTTPNASAQLEVASTTKGFLPPRVALTGTTSASPLAAHVAGMVVYNTATAGDVTPGLYVNNGTAWVGFSSGATSINDLSDGKTDTNSIFLGNSGSNLTTGVDNVGIGDLSLNQVTYGNSNTAVGYASASNNRDGDKNSAFGAESLGTNTTGDNNVAVGYKAGTNTTSGFNFTGSNSVFLGFETKAMDNSETNQIVIGASAIGNGSNTVTIGNASVTGAYVKVPWTVISDARDKNNFVPLDRGLAFINKLKPISFEFRKSRETEETDGIKRFGFKAQDIKAIENGDFVIVDNKDPEHLKIKETALIPILVKAMQEQQKEIDAVQKENILLKKELSNLKALLKGKGLLD